MKRVIFSLILLALVPLLTACSEDANATTPKIDKKLAQIKRGEYLVNFGGCHDCHTPLKMGPKGPEPDMSRALSGHPAQLVLPPAPQNKGPWMWTGAATNTAFAGPWGISYARNLTPDQVSGLGIWNEE